MLTFSVVAAPSNGTLELNSDGTFTYTPNPGYVGTDAFDFSASDGPASATATVTIDVYNTAPEAYDSSQSMLDGQLLHSFVSGFDADGDMVTFNVITSPNNGTLSFCAPTAITSTRRTQGSSAATVSCSRPAMGSRRVRRR